MAKTDYCDHDKRQFSVCPNINKYRYVKGDRIPGRDFPSGSSGEPGDPEVYINIGVAHGSPQFGKFPLDLAAYARAHPAQGEWDETYQEMLTRVGREQKVHVPSAPKGKKAKYDLFEV